ncbi:S1 family peptidase [Candidatus Methylomicrobium oryzae]|uniref:S1 family peptidase n=1 Tax=Candidatus Methylomicrobium oryzae TaxID=2802053 RepID=UPI001920F8AE|nr:trypsin-like serine protease [Methylomicrobium sp. RS1]MBL1262626.1 trypsin-like serine protease [Methylomicrobium sp. RS1]
MNRYFSICLLLAAAVPAFAAVPQPSIVNGRTTQDEPAVGALLLSLAPGASPPAYAGICTGTMIGCRSFLTAAHCVCENARPFLNSFLSEACEPRLATDLRVYLQNSGIHPVSAVHVHPAFEFGVASDIAVLTLALPEQGIPPAAINTAGTPAAGTPGGIVGFGMTSGTADDYGIKRTGNIITANCADADLPQPANICWKYQEIAGRTDSNICFGDSGGPLFIDRGIGRVIAGVSSGVFDDCGIDSFSFGTNIYLNRSYINSKLAGSLDESGKCRIDIRNRLKKYINIVYDAKKQCIDAALSGKTVLADCLSGKAQAKVDKAQAALGTNKLAVRCPAEVIENSKLGGACADAADPAQLSGCLVAAGNDAVARMLDVQYAEAELPIAGKALAECQKTVSGAAKNYFFKNLRLLNQCEVRIDKARAAVAGCPLPSTLAAQEKFAASLQKKILKACPEGTVAALVAGGDRFGGGCDAKSDAAMLAECERDAHIRLVDELDGIAAGKPSAFNSERCGWVSQVGDGITEVFQESRDSGEALPDKEAVLHRFEVPKGIRVLKVTLNGEESFPSSSFNGSFVDNSLDLYLRYQLTPGIDPLAANAISINTGIFEAVQIKNPAVGEWRALIHDAGLATGRAYQLTITMLR